MLADWDFGTVTRNVRKEYFYMHPYYANANRDSLRQALKRTPNDPTMNYYARAVLFGHERIVPALSGEFRPITDGEANSFSREQPTKRPLTYVVTEADSNFDFANIDRWYERDSGERVGTYVLYRVRLRN
jgi:hypothetical protein